MLRVSEDGIIPRSLVLTQ